MPEQDFDLDQWLIENGYGNPGNVSDQVSDWTQTMDEAEQFQAADDVVGAYGEPTIFNFGALLTGATGDTVTNEMYQWAQSNPDYTDTEFAEQLFLSMFWNAEEIAQVEFVNTWNEMYEFEITQEGGIWLGGGSDSDSNLGVNIEEAAAYWATQYGSSIAGTEMFGSGVQMTEYFGEMQANIENAIDSFNAEYGEAAWQSLDTEADLISEGFQLQSQGLVDSLLGQLEGIDIQAGGVRDTYSLLGKKSKSEQSARGLHKRSRGLLDENNLDLQQLTHQLTALDSAVEGAVDAEALEQDLLNLQWDDQLTDMFLNFETQSELAMQDLTFDIDGFVDAYNNALAGEVDFQQSQIWTTIQGIISQGGIAPPPSEGWTSLGGDCITPLGGWGIMCPPGSNNQGSCMSDLSDCFAMPESTPPGGDDSQPDEQMGLNDVFPGVNEPDSTGFQLSDLDEETTEEEE